MKKVALVNPKDENRFAEYEPLNIGCLAAYLLSHNIDARIIDEVAGDNLKEGLDTYRPDIVGITAVTPLIPRAYTILSYAKKRGYTTVIGGPHASALPEEAKKHADFVVTGEGENALLKIVNKETKSRIVQGEFIKNLDMLPWPARHLMKQDYYIDKKSLVPVADHFFLSRGKKLASIITSRGCPYNCIYCYNSIKPVPVRYNSDNRVIKEILHLKEHYSIDALFFMDDDFFINRSRLKSICEILINDNINIEWSANSRVNSIDREILSLAKKAGLRQVNFGIESGSQKVLDVLGKKVKVEQAEYAIKSAKDIGLLVYATIMLGNPSEAIDDLDRTRKFVFRNKIDSLGICITTPYPGTKLWNWCEENNLIPGDYSWKDFNTEKCSVVTNKTFTKADIEKFKNRLVFKFLIKNKFKFLRFYFKGLLKHPIITILKIIRVIKSQL